REAVGGDDAAARCRAPRLPSPRGAARDRGARRRRRGARHRPSAGAGAGTRRDRGALPRRRAPVAPAAPALEFAVSGAIWALRRDSLDDIAAKFLLKFTLVAFLLALITSFTTWIPPIVNGFAAAGERAIGSSVTVSPSGIIDIGRQTALTVLNTLDVGVMLRNPAMALFGALAALLIAIAYIVIAAELVLALIESYLVLGGGVLFLGFAAFRGTAAFADNLIGYTFGVGVKVFLLYLIVGLGAQIAKSWIPLIQASTFFGPTSPLLEVVGGALIFAILTVRVPGRVAGRLSGHASVGIAHALRALS
ncbi:MAG: P-type conjugative transfer protein TrbL, partial [Actinobacteria bacterium]